MILAQIASIAPDWLKNMAIFIACAAATAYYVRGLLGGPQKREVSFDDPPASKVEFDRLVAHNTERHGQLFSAISRVEREAREAMDNRFTNLNEERRATLEKLTEQFAFIRESIAAINRELQIRHHK